MTLRIVTLLQICADWMCHLWHLTQAIHHVVCVICTKKNSFSWAHLKWQMHTHFGKSCEALGEINKKSCCTRTEHLMSRICKHLHWLCLWIKYFDKWKFGIHWISAPRARAYSNKKQYSECARLAWRMEWRKWNRQLHRRQIFDKHDKSWRFHCFCVCIGIEDATFRKCSIPNAMKMN